MKVLTGLRALDTAGHTPGHLSFELAGQEGLLLTADVATNEIVSFEHPDWKFGYDTLRSVPSSRAASFSTGRPPTSSNYSVTTGPTPASATQRKNGAFRFVSAA